MTYTTKPNRNPLSLEALRHAAEARYCAARARDYVEQARWAYYPATCWARDYAAGARYHAAKAREAGWTW
jgi:hypothetical protein